jgi:tRNA(Ile)-lysidine synthase
MQNSLVPSFTNSFHKYFAKGDAVIVGVSGGPDSVALFHLLNLMKYNYNLTIYAAHFNHKLRGRESALDARFVEKLAALYGVPYVYGEKDIRKLALKSKGGIEKTARDERYKFFIESAARLNAAKIAVAHNKDDNAETVLLRMISGSGAEGLSGIPAIRRVNNGEFGLKSLFLKQGRLFIVRPMISILKRDILDYLKSENLAFVTDSSNLSDDYLRNKLRHKLIPEIEKGYNVSVKEALTNTAGILSEENDFLRSTAKAAFDETAVLEGSSVELKSGPLKKMHKAIRLRVLKSALESVLESARKVTSQAVNDADECLSGRGKRSMPEGFICELKDENIVIHREQKLKKSVPVRITSLPSEVVFGGRKFTFEAGNNSAGIDLKERSRAYFDKELIHMPLTLRPRRPGDKFVPYGMKEEVRLKKFFSSTGSEAPDAVIADKKMVIWAAGRVNDRLKVTEKSVKLLKITIA